MSKTYGSPLMVAGTPGFRGVAPWAVLRVRVWVSYRGPLPCESELANAVTFQSPVPVALPPVGSEVNEIDRSTVLLSPSSTYDGAERDDEMMRTPENKRKKISESFSFWFMVIPKQKGRIHYDYFHSGSRL